MREISRKLMPFCIAFDRGREPFSEGGFLHILCITGCFGIRAGFVLEFAPRHQSVQVAPCAGAWIEMYLALTMVRIWHVAPCAGAWIEIGT